MKITYILPGIGKKLGAGYIGTWKMEPPMISTLKALTPADVATEFFDDRLELIDYHTVTDLVAITVETYTARRAYGIAARFRERGIPVLLGGYHPTLLPEEASWHADSICIGNAESIWATVIEDLRHHRMQPVYRGVPGYGAVQPDRSILQGKRYLPLSLVETGRGCIHRCEFCAITSYYQSFYTPRPVRAVAAEIAAAPHRNFFFVDDNIAADPDALRRLCREITPLGIRWASQGSLALARDPELLAIMRRSGCMLMLIGFESLEEKNLEQMGKGWNAKLGDRDELIRHIHASGIGIYATFIFGYDSDTPASFDAAVDFSLDHSFFFAAFNHLLPFPGTPLYHRLQTQGRLLRESWWLDPDYTYGDVAFQPQNMSPGELSQRSAQARRDFFRFGATTGRGLKLLQRTRDPVANLLFWTQNWNLGGEIDEKLSIPLGRGLDELPK